MNYEIIGNIDVIPAITGGVFSFARVLTVSDALSSSPANILASYIIDEAIGDLTNPTAGNEWPLYTSYLPDGTSIKTNAGCLYDTTGIKDGRLMVGEVIQHYGIQLRIRSDRQQTGWVKLEEVMLALDVVFNVIITVNSKDYQIQNISRTSPPISLGTEKGTKGRQLFTLNFIATIKRIV